MDDLVQFLRDRLDEDAATARAAHAPNWSTDGRRGIHYGIEDGWMTDALTTADADHIVRHDPARVLAEVEAKRQIIELCEPSLVDVTGYGPVESRDYIPGEGEAWGLPVLKRLALPHADHPDYREEWRP